jgi:hypothetical protein
MTLAVRAELGRLARVLGVEPDEVAFLGAVPEADLRALRDLIVDHLFDLEGDRLKRIASAGRALPAPVAAGLVEKAVDPVVAGIMVSAVDTRTLLAIAGRLSTRYLADLGPHIDPRRVPDVVARLPRRTIVAVAGELADRRDHATMARFVGHLDDDAILAAVAVLPDEVVVRTAPLVEATDRVDALCAALDDDRLRRLVTVAATPDLVGDCLGLLAVVGPDQLRRIARAAIATGTGTDVIPALVAHAAEADLTEALLPLLSTLADAHDDDLLIDLATEAVDAGLADELVLLLEAADPVVQERIAELAADRPEVLAVLPESLASAVWSLGSR